MLMATSTDDVALVLGASQYQLRVFNLSGEKVCEKVKDQVQMLLVQDLLDTLSKSMDILPYRLSLLHDTLPLHHHLDQPLESFWPPAADLDLTVLVAAEDPNQPVQVSPGRIVEIQRAGTGTRNLQLTVRFLPGKLRAGMVDRIRHAIVLEMPGLLEKSSEESVEVFDAEDTTDVQMEMPVPSGFLPMGFPELAMHFSTVKVDTYVLQGGFFLRHASSSSVMLQRAKPKGLCLLCLLLLMQWSIQWVSLFSAFSLAISAGIAGSYWQCAILAITLWFPSFVWAYRYHCFLLNRKYVGVASFICIILLPLLWCCGVIWLWLPLLAPLVSVLVSMEMARKCFLLLLAVRGCPIGEPAYPLQNEIWAEYEVYMRHVLLCGDFPRILILCVAMWGLHHWTPVWDGSWFLEIFTFASAMLSLFHSCLPHRCAMYRRAWSYFDEVIMELVSD